MAKRKRLNPAANPAPEPPAGPTATSSGPLETKALNGWVGVRARPPIADVTRDAAAQAAFEEVSAELASARRDGRMVIELPLEAVDAGHLVRDRVQLDEDEMVTLMESLRARGQQTPIDVTDLGQGRYGLISGWRRLTALRALYAQGNDPIYAKVTALVRAPEGQGDAYRAMVEENEIRAALSYYERARIAVKAAQEGVFGGPKDAVQSLFSAARGPKRSKIMSFTALVEALDDSLRFPAAIPERLGLSLAARLQEDAGFVGSLRAALDAERPDTPGGERKLLEAALRPPVADKPAPEPDVVPGVALKFKRGVVTLSGQGVDADLMADLRLWLTERDQGM